MRDINIDELGKSIKEDLIIKAIGSSIAEEVGKLAGAVLEHFNQLDSIEN